MDHPILPTEVIIEIASWLPVKALTRCQLVCKAWQSLFRSNYFAHLHSDRSIVFSYFADVDEHAINNPQTQTQPGGFSLMFICNGLLLMFDKAEKTYCVWNPATRRVLELPGPQVDLTELAFSFVPTSKSYRIVSLFHVDGIELGCQVLTLGDGNNVWRRLDFPYRLENKRRIIIASFIGLAGVVHYLFVTSVRECISVDVVSLELETEKFNVSHLPELLGWKKYWNIEWDGELAIVDIVGENMEVMKMEDYRNGRWCEQKKTVHLPFLKKNEDGNIPIVIPLFAAEGEIWFWLKDTRLFTYAMGTGKCRFILEAPYFFLKTRMMAYRPSLVSFEGMVPDTKLEASRAHLALS